MKLDMTFNEICASLKKQAPHDPKLIEAVDNLLGLAIVCSPAALGPMALAALPTLAIKNEIIKAGTWIFTVLSQRQTPDYLQRHETMQMAYGLLPFTAFFDTLDAKLPKALRKTVVAMANEEREALKKRIATSTPDGRTDNRPTTQFPIEFPHPTETLADQIQRHSQIWRHLSQGFAAFVQSTEAWNHLPPSQKNQVVALGRTLEDDTRQRFEAQYFELCRTFDDFAVWANLHAHANTKALISDLSTYVKRYAEHAASKASIDVGFQNLRNIIDTLPDALRTAEANDIALSLQKHYSARINEPIIEDKDETYDDEARLSFPNVADAFIPQAFRVVRYRGKSHRLEDESGWKGASRRNDLGAFLINYLSSPYSTEAPLLILGHPGSGKSLLTIVASAQLMSKHFTVVRVPLREVPADADIASQIEEGIRRIAGISTDSWIKLSPKFSDKPPLVILDGYDELLQASGQVFANYIKEAQRFQQHEAELDRPLRIIITSRITLIDKATVPAGATIIRLMEFDKGQRLAWSTIWNSANSAYFKQKGLEKFKLPDEKEAGSEKILALAEQPLLLLMLALYDSQNNQLRESKGLDRTKLYDSLLRRFVLREREKESDFNDSSNEEQQKVIEREMRRLGVAALGMYNRRKVHILSLELDDDLAFFKLERTFSNSAGRLLSQADLLLGSFFFVHKSKAQYEGGANDHQGELSAFEFLHNTFGEFLTADFILRRTAAQVATIHASSSNEALRTVLERMLTTADGFDPDWLASLVYTPLFTRPVIMEMIREWAPHVFLKEDIGAKEFVDTFERILINQVDRLLTKREMPSILRKEAAQEGYHAPFDDHPLLGHIAIYSINLILIRLIIGPSQFDFNESQITHYEDGARPWDRLTHIWRSWFSLSNLTGVTGVMIARRDGSNIRIEARKIFQVKDTSGTLEAYTNVAATLADDANYALAGLALFNPRREDLAELNRIEECAHSEGLDLDLPIALRRMSLLELHLPNSMFEFSREGARAIELASRAERMDELAQIVVVFARGIERAMRRRGDGPSNWGRDWRRDIHERISPDIAVDITSHSLRAGGALWSSARASGDRRWQEEFAHRLFDRLAHDRGPYMFQWVDERTGTSSWFLGDVIGFLREVGGPGNHIEREMFERILHPHRLLDLIEQNPAGAIGYLRFARDVGGGRMLHRLESEMLQVHEEGTLLPRSAVRKLIEHDPSAIFSYVQLISDSSGFHEIREIIKDMGPVPLEHILHPNTVRRGIIANSDETLSALHVLLMAKNNMPNDWKYKADLREDHIHNIGKILQEDIVVLSNSKPIAIWATYARLIESAEIADIVARCIETHLTRGRAPLIFSKIPISAISQLRWVADQVACGALGAELDNMIMS